MAHFFPWESDLEYWSTTYAKGCEDGLNRSFDPKMDHVTSYNGYKEGYQSGLQKSVILEKPLIPIQPPIQPIVLAQPIVLEQRVADSAPRIPMLQDSYKDWSSR